jgi:hypothetical protein
VRDLLSELPAKQASSPELRDDKPIAAWIAVIKACLCCGRGAIKAQAGMSCVMTNAMTPSARNVDSTYHTPILMYVRVSFNHNQANTGHGVSYSSQKKCPCLSQLAILPLYAPPTTVKQNYVAILLQL